MNWFTCNYMNLVGIVLHILLMLSPSGLTALLDMRQIFFWTLLYQLSHFSWTDPWVLFVLSYFVCWDFRIRVDCSTGSFACPLCCVFLAELGLIPFNLELTFTFLPLWSVGTSHTLSLTHYISHTLSTNIVILLSSLRHHGQGITLRPTVGTPTQNNMRSNWNFLLGRYPWHVGRSNTINMLLHKKILILMSL